MYAFKYLVTWWPKHHSTLRGACVIFFEATTAHFVNVICTALHNKCTCFIKATPFGVYQ